ncbi:MAG TPA: MarR family transcriptional regulator [Jiangellaceae bacterium]|nr:MarR family transcriptional regulator [Jiangellaceae bacterium]
MSVSSRDQTALDRLLELAVVISEDMSASLTAMGLTGARTRVLWELQRNGPMTQRQLAEALDVTPRNVTGLIDALVETGFVTREPHPKDRRATLVTFTDKGAATAADLERGHEEFAHLLFADLPDDTVAGFVGGIDLVLNRLYEHGTVRTEEFSA